MSKEVRYKVGVIFAIALAVEVLFWIGATSLFIFIPQHFEQVNIERPKMLWAMLVLPVFMLFYLYTVRTKNKNMELFGDRHLLEFIVPDISSLRSIVRYVCIRLGLAAVLFALAGPQIGTKVEKVKTVGIDVMIAVDVSNSMLAQDLNPNRMEVAKRSIQQLLAKLKSDRIGIVVFAGEAYTQLPITNDHSAARIFLNNLDPGIVGAQGTAIGAAIEQCMRGFDMENGSSKSIIVLTDGENHEDNAETAAEAAAELGVIVHTIGMGSIEGAPIPIMKGGRVAGFKEDKTGKTVVSKLDDNMLEQIAAAGNGVFIRAATSRAAIDPLMKELRAMDQTEAGTYQYAGYEDQFQFFLGAGCVLLFLSLIITESRGKLWNSKTAVA